MSKKVLILHAWYSTPEKNWYPWLKRELEKKNYTVYLPLLPTMDTDRPDMKQQLEFIQKIAPIDEDTTIIGHSLGCLLAMRLAENIPYKKMILVAGWDFDDLSVEHVSFWPNKINHKNIKSNVKEIYCFSSDNDPYITAFQAEKMSKRLGGTFILINGAGHFTTKDKASEMPQLLQYL